jgi:nicotinamide riboside kinase
MKKIICLWGGPGTGKSLVCAGLYRHFKSLHLNVEMNREYIKDWVWEGREILPGDQIYITAKQARKEVLYMRKNMDIIITDSPLALTTYYGNLYDKYEKDGNACKAIVKQHHMICKDLGYKIDHFFLNRTKPYNPVGRLQDEKTALEYDKKIKIFLDEYPINYKTVICDDEVENSITKLILS